MQTRLQARPVEARTKGEIKRLRQQGFVPVSIQHRGEETRHLQEEAGPLDTFIHQHGEGLLELVVAPENKRETVIVHDVQRDPLSHRLLHVTFQSVQKNEFIKVHVPVVLHGTPEPVHMGTAMIRQPLETVEIRCLPKDLPDHFTMDISRMAFGNVLRVADLPASKKYEMLTAPDTVLASLATLKVHEPEAEEPEVVVTPETEPIAESEEATASN